MGGCSKMLLGVAILMATGAGLFARVNVRTHQPLLPYTFVPVMRPDALWLYDADGNRVLACEKHDAGFDHCRLEPGVSLDEETNAWVNAYNNKGGS